MGRYLLYTVALGGCIAFFRPVCAMAPCADVTDSTARMACAATASSQDTTSADASKKLSFYVKQNGALIPVNSYDVDPAIRDISVDKLKAFLKNGYIQPKKLSNGEYKLYAKVRGPGGSVIISGAVYWTVKGVGYAVPGILAGSAAASAVAATGGGAALASFCGGFVGKGLTGTAAAMTSSAAPVAASGATSVAGGALGYGAAQAGVTAVGTTVAADAVGTTAAATAGAGGYFAAVEVAATAAAGLAALIPLP